MQRQEKLRGKIDGLRERIRELELRMQGVNSTNMNVQTLEPIAKHFQRLINDVMGRDVHGTPNWNWNLGYTLDYNKVLDYVMNQESSLNTLEMSGLQMLLIPLDIIDVWIQFVEILCGLPSILTTQTAQNVNEYLGVIKHTVDIMRRIVLAANMKLIGTNSQHKNALSTYGHKIIPDGKKNIYSFFRADRRLSKTFFEIEFFFETMHMWDSFRNISAFMHITFMDDFRDKFEE